MRKKRAYNPITMAICNLRARTSQSSSSAWVNADRIGTKLLLTAF